MAHRLLQVAGVGNDPAPIIAGAKAFPVTKIVLLYDERDAKQALDVVAKLAPFKCDVDHRVLRGPPLTAVLSAMAAITREEALHFDDVLVNVTVSDKMLSCSLMSAAFMHGVRAIAVQNGETIQLPVLKFAYREMISESKMNILRALDRAGGAVESLNDLSEMSGVEKSLLSYHIRGGRDAKGLEELNLVAIERAKQGRLMVRLTDMGRLLLLGGGDLKVTPHA